MQKNSDAQIALFVRDEKTMYLISLYSIGWKSEGFVEVKGPFKRKHSQNQKGR